VIIQRRGVAKNVGCFQRVALLLSAASGADSAAAGRLYDRVIDYPLVTSDVGLSMVGAKFGWSAVAPIAFVCLFVNTITSE